MSTNNNQIGQNPYEDFHLQYIAGEWQSGQDDSVNADVNPLQWRYTGGDSAGYQRAARHRLSSSARGTKSAGRSKPQASELLSCIKWSIFGPAPRRNRRLAYQRVGQHPYQGDGRVW